MIIHVISIIFFKEQAFKCYEDLWAINIIYLEVLTMFWKFMCVSEWVWMWAWECVSECVSYNDLSVCLSVVKDEI